jgi:hypothetical protein
LLYFWIIFIIAVGPQINIGFLLLVAFEFAKARAHEKRNEPHKHDNEQPECPNALNRADDEKSISPGGFTQCNVSRISGFGHQFDEMDGEGRASEMQEAYIQAMALFILWIFGTPQLAKIARRVYVANAKCKADEQECHPTEKQCIDFIRARRFHLVQLGSIGSH